ncbi:MAG TPA: electron transport complex subunit RsxE [Caldisericia bacterium]|jgi:electron transport complex protein RnfE|nr:electron transport complex subunit RsxE [Caldisericia bacterium]HXK50951.1 electron transport complex subunit RsxE [Caldisericia bacterium]
MKSNFKNLLTKGLIKENPVFVLMLGLCSVLAVSVSVVNALGMTLAFTFVTILSEITISILRKWIPKSLRIPIFIVVIASFVTILQFLLQAYLPSLNKALGIFIPLIVVNCIIIGRIESFASKKPVFESILDGLGISLGYGIAIVCIAIVREILGNGTILGFPILGSSYEPALMFILPPGAFLVIGIEIGIMNHITKKASRKGVAR